jgi:RecB family exonuclease
LDLEQKYSTQIGLDNRLKLRIGGVFDRIDEKEGRVRIIDYKTGEKKNTFQDLAALFELPGSKRNNAVFQTFVYALIYKKNKNTPYIVPGLYFVRDIFSEGFDYRIFRKELRSAGVPVENAADYLPEFEQRLKEVLDRLMDPENPFTQTKDTETCRYCPYRIICHRQNF